MLAYKTKGTEGTIQSYPNTYVFDSTLMGEVHLCLIDRPNDFGTTNVVLALYNATSGDMEHIARDVQEERSLKDDFAVLTARWKHDTRLQSSVEIIAIHPAYQRIIGMGKRVIPLILKDLEQSGGQWYWALRAITGESPISPEARGKIPEMKKAWLDWGRRVGYIE